MSATAAPRTGLARALSKRGYCSRSAAEALIAAGRVRLDGRRVTDSETPTTRDSRIEVDGVAVTPSERVYLMLNKPRGFVTTAADEHGRATLYDCLRDANLPWVAPVGRLDKASEGLLLLTNDTAWAAAIASPAHEVRKTYHVKLRPAPTDEQLTAMRAGVEVAGGETLGVSNVTLLRQTAKSGWVEIGLCEGRNRQIRRLCEALGLTVERLLRVAIGPLQLGTLARGEWRLLAADEISALRRAAT